MVLNQKLSNSLILNIKEDYIQGIGTLSISKKYDIHPSTVQKYLKQDGLIPQKQKYTHDRNFFDEYNEISSYWAGFILADGYIKSNRHMIGIHLQQSDQPHLQKFLNAIQSTNVLIPDIHSNAICVQLYSKELKQQLTEKYLIVPQKSKITTFPLELPPEYHHHFIRGIFDGDGCITISSCPSMSLVGTFSLLTSVNNIIEQQTDLLLNNGHTKSAICIPNKNKPWFASISYSGKNAKKVLTWIYHKSSPETRLDRKYNLFQQHFTTIGDNNE